MNPKSQIVSFVLAFSVLFVLLSGIGFLSARLDWTLIKILTCIVIVSGATFSWSLIKKESVVHAFRDVGFGAPDWRAVGLAIGISALMIAFFPIYTRVSEVDLTLQGNWPWILIGIIAGVGIAEETLFRGFAFHFLRERFTFWKAATYSMFLFGLMHLLLLLWLPLPIALAAILLSILAAYPTAYLFEKGNRTVWASAILHSTALVTNLFVIPPQVTVSLSLLWISVILICMFLIFPIGRLLFAARLKSQFST
jgi:membrane protease YdiL (CAAX protease family)